MEKDENRDKKIEQDIAKCKQDVLSATRKQQNPLDNPGSMPSFGDIMKKPPAKDEFVSNMVEKISKADKADKSQDMPTLDLGMQILAKQRKIAALKRKSPGKENNPPQMEKQGIIPTALNNCDHYTRASEAGINDHKLPNVQVIIPTGITFRPIPIKEQPNPVVFPIRSVHAVPAVPAAAPASPQQMIIADIVAKEILALSATSATRIRQSR